MRPGPTDLTGATGDTTGAGLSYVENVGVKALYGLKEAAKLLGRPQQTVSDWADTGAILTVKMGRRRYVPLSALRQHGVIWESILLALNLNAGRASE